MSAIARINREELKAKLDHAEKVKLVMAMNEWAYQTAHIPGSLHFNSTQEALQNLDRDEEIIVYCTGLPCPASLKLYRRLQQAGYHKIRHYAGGLVDWDAAGYPLAGKMAIYRSRN